MLAKPANVPSFGARSGGEGSLASPGVVSASVIPVDGSTARSLPEASRARSGAVSAARSRSIGHLNLSQPLGSSAAHAGAARSSSNATRTGARMSIHRDHDVGSLDHDGDLTLGLDAEVIDRLVGDRGGDDLAAADVDANMGSGRAFLHLDDGALDLIACTDAHDASHTVVPRAVAPACFGLKCGTVVPDEARDARLRRCV